MIAPCARTAGVLPVVLPATFLQLLDVTIVQVALPTVGAGLDAGPGALELVLAGYTLTYAAVLVAAARLGDRHGYRALFALGLAVFTGASAACAAAPDVAVLVGARLVQGLGSGLMAPQVLALIRTGLPPGGRARGFAAFGATMAVASLAGPLAGGLLLAVDGFGLGWRTLFLVNVPIGLAALAGARSLPRGTGGTVGTDGTDGGVGADGTAGRVDVAGALLLGGTVAALVLPLALGPGAGFPWWSWALLGLAAVAGAGFALSQRRARVPLVHPSAARDPAVRRGIATVLVVYAGIPAFSYVLLRHLQTADGLTPLAAALVNAPWPVGAALGSRVAPRLAHRLGPRLPAGATVALAAVAGVLAVLVGSGAPVATLPPVLGAGGVAFGLFVGPVFALVLDRAAPAAVGSASGLLPTAQQVGGSVGVALAGLAYGAGSFGSAMAYEGAVFLLAAACAAGLRRTGTR